MIYFGSYDFVLSIRHLGALTFVPKHAVKEAFENLLGSEFFIKSEKLLIFT